MIKQCGNCEFWDLSDIRTNIDTRISDCKSTDIRAESFIDHGEELFERYPMLENEGFECSIYKERVNDESS